VLGGAVQPHVPRCQAIDPAFGEVCPFKIGFDKNRKLQIRLEEIGVAKVRAAQIGPEQVGTSQVGALQPCSGQVGAPQPGAGQIRPFQVGAGAAVITLTQIRIGEECVAKTGALEIGTGQVGEAEFRLIEHCPAEIRLAQPGGVESRFTKVGLGELRAVQPRFDQIRPV
jgi:hypothetical protein